MALGANRLNVLRLILRGALLQTALGLAVGIPLAIGGAKLLGSQLFRVQIWDPPALGSSVLTLLLCAVIAALVPARRAASIEPMKALRAD